MTPKPVSDLAQRLENGLFAVTAEVTLPDSIEKNALVERAQMLEPYCDAINITDSTGAVPHFSNIAAASILIENDIEPIIQFSCRDRNRIAVQADVIGAHAMGVRNIFCVTGDGVQTGDHPEAKPVFDLDSVTLLTTINHLKTRGKFLSGRELDAKPNLYLGAAVNPFVPPFEERALRLLKKHKAGASFFQTQYCFDIERFKSFLDRLLELTEGTPPPLLVGVGPLRSARFARWLRENVPGVAVPDHVIEKIEKYPRNEQQKAGVEACIEIVDAVKTLTGVAGIHVMAYNWEASVSEIVEATGLSKPERDK